MNSLLILLTTLSMSISTINNPAAPITAEDMLTTIILIDGDAHLVDLSEGGELLISYGVVTEYFASSKTHEEIVDASMTKYREEVEDDLDRIKFLSFESYSAVLNQVAINHIREMAVRAEEDANSNILITVGTTDPMVKEDLRVNKVVELFTNFGVDTDRIEIVEKRYIGSIPNHFIKIEINPSL